MKDLMKALEARAAEISQYIAEIQNERESHNMRLTELDMNQKSAEADLRKVNRALGALVGDDEDFAIPMGPKPESPRAQELQGMTAAPRNYSPETSR